MNARDLFVNADAETFSELLALPPEREQYLNKKVKDNMQKYLDLMKVQMRDVLETGKATRGKLPEGTKERKVAEDLLKIISSNVSFMMLVSDGIEIENEKEAVFVILLMQRQYDGFIDGMTPGVKLAFAGLKMML